MVVERDRSQELYVIFENLRQSFTTRESTHGKSVAHALRSNSDVQKFNRYAQAFSMDIANVSDSISRLTKLISRQNVFDDQSTEISALTQVVKASLQRLHNDLETLEELKRRSLESQRSGQLHSAYDKDRFFIGGPPSHLQTSQKHSDAVVDTLKSRLARTGQQFRSTLQHQSMNIKTNASRRQFFTAVDKPQTFESALFQDQEQHSQMQLAVGMGNAQYYRQRVEAVSEIETAVAEVGELFKDFTRLVHEQDEVILRIDSDVGSALDNVNAGTNELMRYLTSISSNRGLILKIFAIIFCFLVFFGFVVVFLAYVEASLWLTSAVYALQKDFPPTLEMHESRLQSSQELTPLIVNVEQSFSPCGVFATDFPCSPLTSQNLHKAASPGTLPQAPGGSSSTATASIARPEVRHRSEWSAALEDVETFKMPADCFLSSDYRANALSKVPVRCIADQFDRRWLANRFMEGRQEGCTSKDGVVRGKTGHLGSAPRVNLDLTISLFEDIITAFELAAFYNPEISLERLVSLNRLYFEGIDASSAVIAEVHEYWLRKREALGGNIACIPALQTTVCDENESAICRANVLGDCPLPFKARDWVVPCITRRKCRTKKRKKKVPDTSHKKEGSEGPIIDFVAVANSLSMQILRRERLCHKHALISIYEMAVMRNLSGVNLGMLHESPSWATPTVDLSELQQEVDRAELEKDFFAGLSMI